MRPVIFLDFDGVLNCESTDWSVREIDHSRVVILNDLVRRTNAYVVLSSSWRSSPDWMDFPRQYGFEFNFLDRTPRMHGKPRGYEIYSWLKKNRDLKNYAILDDDSDMLALQKPHFFKTDFKFGLTQEIADAVAVYLIHSPHTRKN